MPYDLDLFVCLPVPTCSGLMPDRVRVWSGTITISPERLTLTAIDPDTGDERRRTFDPNTSAVHVFSSIEEHLRG